MNTSDVSKGTASGLASVMKPTRMRYFMVGLLFIGAAINYLDRTNISVTASNIQNEMGLSPAMLGLVFSAFGWTYALAQIPGGWLLDRFGPRWTYGVALIVWSLFTVFQGFATGFIALIVFRLGLGLFEAPASPTNSRVVAAWFPKQERARATGIWTAGQFVGLAFLTPMLFWIQDYAGWRAVFYVTGGVGLIWAVFWFKYYKDPSESDKVNQAELDLIAAGEGVTEQPAEQLRFSWANLFELFRHRQLIGIYIGQIAIVTTLYFFLTWFPTYLSSVKGISLGKDGWQAALPYVCAFFGVLFGGYLSDKMIQKGYELGTARKTPIIIGLLLACVLILANYSDSKTVVIAIMSVAFFGQGMSNLTWTIVSDIAPKEMIGLAGGVFNFVGNLASITTPLIIGLIVDRSGSFNGALVFVGAAAMMGAFSYLFVIGKLHRITVRVS
jgi:MFS transporter, ACS family, D-galactonate transporter